MRLSYKDWNSLSTSDKDYWIAVYKDTEILDGKFIFYNLLLMLFIFLFIMSAAIFMVVIQNYGQAVNIENRQNLIDSFLIIMRFMCLVNILMYPTWMISEAIKYYQYKTWLKNARKTNTQKFSSWLEHILGGK